MEHTLQNSIQAYALIRYTVVTLLMLGAIVAAPFPLLLGYVYGCGWAHICL